MGDAGGKLRELWNGLETKGQLTLVGAAVGVIAVFYLLMSVASRPSYQTLLTNVDPAETSTIASALNGAGVSYQLKNGGTEVDVKSGQATTAEVALAAKGLPKGNQVGFEIFDKSSLGQTQFQQQVDYQRALEGEIGRAVQQIDGVTSADVQLVLPQDSLFADSSSKASASILLTTAQTLDASTVSGIAHLVAGSVKGLSPNDVTITDGTGTMLWPTSGSDGLAATAKLQAQQQYGTDLSNQINAMLAQTLGPNKAQVRVQADLNVNQTSIDSTTYAKKGVPVSTQTSNETLASKGGATPQTPTGTSSNVPSYTGSTATGTNGSSNYKNTTSNTQYGLDKTVQHTTVAPGSINRLDVALLLDQSIPAAQATAIKASVASMAGLVAKRGDTITVSRFAFAKPPAATTTPVKTGPLANPMGLAKYVAIGLGALIFLLLMRRGLRRREGEAIAPEPVWLREIETQTPVAQLEAAASPAHQRALAQAHEQRQAVRDEVEQIVKREPEQIASQVGQWLKE